MERDDRHDVRQGGAWTFGQSLKNAILFGAARCLLALLGPLPRAFLVRLGRALGALCHAVLRGERNKARANVARVLPGMPAREADALVARTFRTLGENLGDTVDLYGKARLSPSLPFEAGSLEVLDHARREGRGVVLASGHLGPWERVAASFVEAGCPLVTLAREAYDPRLTGELVRLRERHGVRAIFRGSPGAAARIVRTLRRGEVLGAPMDLASRVPSVPVEILGHEAPTAVGPARIALRSGARVVVGSFVGGVIRVTPVPTDDLRAGPGAEVELCRRINAELTRRILESPEHWPWMHDRFRTSPQRH